MTDELKAILRPRTRHTIDETGLGDALGKAPVLTAKGGGGSQNPCWSDGDKHDTHKMTVMTHVTCDGKPWDLLIVMKQGNGCTEATVEMQRVLREGGCTGGVHMNSTGMFQAHDVVRFCTHFLEITEEQRKTGKLVMFTDGVSTRGARRR